MGRKTKKGTAAMDDLIKEKFGLTFTAKGGGNIQSEFQGQVVEDAAHHLDSFSGIKNDR